MADNSFERAARAKKVARIVRHLTELFEPLNLHPERDGAEMAQLVRTAFGDCEWTELAVQCGSPGASVTTRLMVLEALTRAQRKAAS
jgi:hypothetical protein